VNKTKRDRRLMSSRSVRTLCAGVSDWNTRLKPNHPSHSFVSQPPWPRRDLKWHIWTSKLVWESLRRSCEVA